MEQTENKTKVTRSTPTGTTDDLISVKRVHKLEASENALKGYADLQYGDVVIKGLKIVEGSKGLFMSMPRRKWDDKYVDAVYPVTKELRTEMSDKVLAAFNAVE